MDDTQLKLDFLKRVILDTVEQDTTLTFFNTKQYPSREKMNLVVQQAINERRLEGKDWPQHAHSMIGLKRFDNLNSCLEQVRTNNIKGDFIETGVWRGGACIFMHLYNKLYSMNRKVYVADSFKGLPVPDPRYIADRGDVHYTYSELAVSRQQVENNFALYEALDTNVIFLEGWFKDTLNNANIEKLSILRLDGDMYGSTMDALNALYDKLQPGGALIIDDYGLQGCASAIHDFRNSRGITTEIKKIDFVGAFWIKE
jgi:O-methyltransferase